MIVILIINLIYWDSAVHVQSIKVITVSYQAVMCDVDEMECFLSFLFSTPWICFFKSILTHSLYYKIYLTVIYIENDTVPMQLIYVMNYGICLVVCVQNDIL